MSEAGALRGRSGRHLLGPDAAPAPASSPAPRRPPVAPPGAARPREFYSRTGAEWLGFEQRLEKAMPSVDQFIVWIMVGLLGGSLAGLIIRGERKGLGSLRNLG